MQLFNRFAADRKGVTAITFALSIIPVMGMAGAAVDYGRASAARAELQRAADATALHLSREALFGRTADADEVFAGYAAQASLRVEGLDVEATSLDATTFRVDATGTVRTTIASIVIPTVDIGVTATATAERDPLVSSSTTENLPTRYSIERAMLSVEAADYNELRAYCYDETTDRRNNPKVLRDPDIEREELRESDLVEAPRPIKIADNTNAGVADRDRSFEMYCDAGQQLSFHLVNIRNARTNPARIANPPRNAVWNHYTDTRMVDGVSRYETEYRDLIETILCETPAQCDPTSPERIIPGNAQRNRNPQVNTRACLPGQLMYFGWEDRPPHIGDWTDQDYDDIRVVMSCGVGQPLVRTTTTTTGGGNEQVWLID